MVIKRIYEGTFPVAYGQFYLLPDNTYGADLEDSFRGQRNGMCGTAVQESAFLITGLHTGNIHLSFDILDAESSIEIQWHDVVEAPIRIGTCGLWLVSWGDEIEYNLELDPGDYRIRYCAQNMGDEDQLEEEPLEPIEKYLLEIWPSEFNPDCVLKQTSESSEYWHSFATGLEFKGVIELERTNEKIRPNNNASPEFVYIPTNNAYSVVTIELQTQVKVGEWIDLFATRESSPWRQMKFTELSDSSEYSVKEPPTFEEQVAANVSWKVEPSGESSFDVATSLEEAQSNLWGRSVQFHKAGKYRIQGFSAYPVRCESNIVEITVVD